MRALVWLRIQNDKGLLSLSALAFYAGLLAGLYTPRGVVIFALGAALHLARGWFEYRRSAQAAAATHELARAGAKDAAAIEKRIAELEQRLSRFGQEHAEEKLAAGLRRK